MTSDGSGLLEIEFNGFNGNLLSIL